MRKYLSLVLTITFATVFISFYSCSNSGSSSDSRVLKFNWQKGKTYDFEMVMDMDQEVMQQKNKMSFIAAYGMTVTDDDGKIKSLTAEYKDFKMKMSMMGQEINIDGAKKPVQFNNSEQQNDPSAMLANAFSGIIGKKFYLKADEMGEILEVTGFQELINSMIAAMKLPDEARLMVEASLKDQFSAEKIKESFAPMFNIYPGREIKLGDSWERSYELKSGAAAKYTTQYTVKSFDGDKVLLDTKTKVESITDTSSANSSGGMQMSGTQSGVMTVNLTSGLVLDGELIQNLETSGDLKMKMVGKIKMKGRERN
jgi:hypothetical protein